MTTLTPLLEAPLAVQLHVIGAIEALCLTPFVLLRRRRDRLHRWLGYAWVTNLAMAALTSFMIMELRVIGPFSPIHILSALTLIWLWQAITAIRNKNRRRHEGLLRHTAFWSVGVAGVLSFLPGRMMHDMFLADGGGVLFWVMAGVALVLWAWFGLGLGHRRRALNP